MTFSSTLISWYEANKRDLPFRGTRDPYLIWVSEVILQQTRMEQGVTQYLRFIERFPDLLSLAAASEEEVLQIWQGMGYYSRARNLHASARVVVNDCNGIFPSTFDTIKRLKGIGDYSAASIASLAFDEPQAAIDGNVFRFMARYFGYYDEAGSSSGKRKVKEKIAGLIDTNRPGIFNQAMIEFGALVCKPVNPSCTHCMFQDSCYAFQHRLIQELPAKPNPVKTKRRFFHYLVIRFEVNRRTRIIMNKRQADDIWKNLYDFPLIESNRKLSRSHIVKTPLWRNLVGDKQPKILQISEEYKHLLSHQHIHAVFYQVSLAEPPQLTLPLISVEYMESVPVPRLISRYWKEYFQ